MTLEIKGKSYDTMKEACERLDLSRQTMLRYLSEGYFSEPKRQRQGRSKQVRYFDEDWYEENEAKLRNEQRNDGDANSPQRKESGAVRR